MNGLLNDELVTGRCHGCQFVDELGWHCRLKLSGAPKTPSRQAGTVGIGGWRIHTESTPFYTATHVYTATHAWRRWLGSPR